MEKDLYIFHPVTKLFNNAFENKQCTALTSKLSSKVSYPGSTPYNSSLTSYFSLQESTLSPSCIVTPTSTADVVAAVSILASSQEAGKQCTFAIRSGGHASFAGQANINSGVTLDLSSLNNITVSSDKTVTSIGPGTRWGQVYLLLDSMGLSVAGGRAAQVGVGGLSTGGEHPSPPLLFSCCLEILFLIYISKKQVEYPTFLLAKDFHATTSKTSRLSWPAAKSSMLTPIKTLIYGSR